MVSWICRNVRSVLQTKPWRLWGVSLLAGLLTWLGVIGFVGVPAVAFCLDLALTGSRWSPGICSPRSAGSSGLTWWGVWPG